LSAKSPQPLSGIVPNTLEITVELNIGEISRTPELRRIVEGIIGPEGLEGFDDLYAFTGVDIRNDIDRILFAGFLDESRKDDGIMMVEGRFSREELASLLSMSGDYDILTMGNQLVHQFWDEDSNDLNYCVFLADNLLAMGHIDHLTQLIRCWEHKKGRLSDNRKFAALAREAGGDTVVQVVAIAPDLDTVDPGGRAILKGIEA
jgi:hypothetical protein